MRLEGKKKKGTFESGKRNIISWSLKELKVLSLELKSIHSPLFHLPEKFFNVQKKKNKKMTKPMLIQSVRSLDG